MTGLPTLYIRTPLSIGSGLCELRRNLLPRTRVNKVRSPDYSDTLSLSRRPAGATSPSGDEACQDTRDGREHCKYKLGVIQPHVNGHEQHDRGQDENDTEGPNDRQPYLVGHLLVGSLPKGLGDVRLVLGGKGLQCFLGHVLPGVGCTGRKGLQHRVSDRLLVLSS